MSTPEQRLEGAMLMAVGALIALLCGLCSLRMVVGSFEPGSEDGMFLVFVPFVGGVPTVCGIYLVWRGWMMRKGL